MNSLSNQIHEQFYKMRVGLFKQLNEQVSEQVRTQVVNRAKRVKQNIKL